MLIRSFVSNLVLLGASILLSLAIIEGALRVAGFSYPIFSTIDPNRGFALAPGAEGWQTNEGRAYLRVNSQGLRDHEHEFNKPNSTIRIAILGDSYAEARQVSIEDTFWSVLGKSLENCRSLRGQTVEVINFGVSGYGTAQELITLRHHVWKYDPDIVLLAFLTGNDVKNNSLALNGNTTIPYFLYRDGKLELFEEFRTFGFRFKLAVGYDIWRSWLIHLRLFQLLKKSQIIINYLFDAQQPSAPNEQANGVDLARGELGLDNAVYAPPLDSDWVEAWRTTEAILLQMRNEVVSRGSDFWIVTLSNGIQVHPDREVRERFMESLGIDTLYYPDSRIRDLSIQNGVKYIDLAKPLSDHAERHQVYLHGFDRSGSGHWNAAGHRVAGLEIAAQICKSIPKQ